MHASNEQKQERTEKMIVVKKSPKWWATATATGGLIVGMTGGFGLGMLATANTTPQRQQAAVATQNSNQPAQNSQEQNVPSNSQGFDGQNGGPGQGQMNGQPPQGGGPEGGQGQDGFGGGPGGMPPQDGQNGGPGQGNRNGQPPQDGGPQGQQDNQQNGKSNKKSSKKSSSKKSSSNTNNSSKDETGTAG